MNRRTASLVILTALIAVFFVSCSINESDQPARGVVYISAYDTTSSTEIIGAEISINGVIRSQTTPSYISGVEEGINTIKVTPSLYYSQEMDIVVSPPDTTDSIFEFYVPDDSPINNQTIIITSNIPEAQLTQSGQFIPDAVFPYTKLIVPGDYVFSSFIDGYQLLNPQEGIFTAVAGDTLEIGFAHEELAIGSSVGSLAADFKLPNHTETDSFSVGQYRGYILHLTFWFRDCSACMEEMPAIVNTYNELSAEGYRVLAVNSNFQNDSQELYQEVQDIFGMSFPLIMYTGSPQEMAEKFGYIGNPHNVLIDRHGVIRYALPSVEEEQLMGYVQELLDE